MWQKSQTNLIGSITSTTENIPQDKTVCRTKKTNKIVNTVKVYTTGKEIIWKKPFYYSNNQTIDSSNRSIRSRKKLRLSRHGSRWVLRPYKFWQLSLWWQFNRLYRGVYIVMLHIKIKTSFVLIQIRSQVALIVHSFFYF